AREMRAIIRQKLQAGENRDQILRYFVAQFGESVLAEPRPGGVALILYGGTPVALILGVAAAILFIRRRGARPSSREAPEVPPGMRDLLPGEAARARGVTDRLLARLRRWGYREVATPTIEYFDTLVRGEGTEAGDRLFKLVDRGGELLALRPEMTTPVARLITTHLRGRPLPLRLAYAGQVFRGSETGSGRLREFPQVGCELIGADTLEADAEIVALAVDALAASGAAECSVSLGHVGFLRGILE